MNDIQLYEDIVELKSTFPVKVRTYRAQSIPAHWHEHIELLYLLSGNTTFVCNAKGIAVRRGDLVVVNSGELHYFESETEIEYVCIIIEASLLTDAGCGNVLLQSRIPPDATVSSYVRTLVQNSESPHAASELVLKGTACLLIAHLIDCYTAEKLLPSKYDLRLSRMKKTNALLDFMHENYNCPLTTASLAEAYHFSEGHLCRIFRAATGKTVTQYLNQIRIEKAAVLLKNTDESVSGISQSVGFESLNYFDRVFRKRFGCSPVEYKRNFRASDEKTSE